ncbi:phosphotransferase [Nesterenkonia ebinurensis]|uniref:phosphotransferase n=1 Tax=Nesterenkonia ebinurensis TaxID=2608252 RepID=UPI00123D5147|nr:phosphotransferase [Nesterenkonia ebinurensis]
MENALPLTGGNASGCVVQIGSTVRKPWTAGTTSVHSFISAVGGAGVDVPAVLGRDDQGRQIIEFIPGRLAMETDPLAPSELARVGTLVRAIHDASAAFRPPDRSQWEPVIPAPGEELICHNDLAPWNLIIGDRWVFIDWDGAGPSTRLWDLAYAAQTFTLNDPDQRADEAALNLVAFVDGYGARAELRRKLPRTMHQRAYAMYELLSSSVDSGREPWKSMYAQGHGAHWQAVSEYVKRHHEVWAQALSIQA